MHDCVSFALDCDTPKGDKGDEEVSVIGGVLAYRIHITFDAQLIGDGHGARWRL